LVSRRHARTGRGRASLEAALAAKHAGDTAEAEVLRRYHLEGATLQDIASTLGVSIARVLQIRSAGEKRLREDLTVLAHWHAHFGG